MSRLPEYMVPSDILVVVELPYTVTGKVDRQALPGLISKSRSDARGGRTSVDTRSEGEAAITRVCARVLGAEFDSIGVTDDLFMLGLTSLSAVRLVHVLRNELGLSIEGTVTVMQYPTVGELAGQLWTTRKLGASDGAPDDDQTPHDDGGSARSDDEPSALPTFLRESAGLPPRGSSNHH